MILVILALTAFGVLLELACDAFVFVGEFLKEDVREMVGAWLMRFTALSFMLLLLGCPPHVTPEECSKLCAESNARVCEYSDDTAGRGLCVCSDELGRCVAEDAGE